MCIGAVATLTSCAAAAHAKRRSRNVEKIAALTFVGGFETSIPEVNEEWGGDYSKTQAIYAWFNACSTHFQISVSR
jgi:hypothetical protein